MSEIITGGNGEEGYQIHISLIHAHGALWEMIEEYSHLYDHKFSTPEKPYPSKVDPLIMKAKNALLQMELTFDFLK